MTPPGNPSSDQSRAPKPAPAPKAKTNASAEATKRAVKDGEPLNPSKGGRSPKQENL